MLPNSVSPAVKHILTDFQFGDSTVFWIPALLGAHMVLPTKYVAELKNHKDLNFFDYIEDAFPGTGLKERFLSGSFVKIVKKHLTRDLNQFTGVLSDETAEALDEMIPAKDGMLRVCSIGLYSMWDMCV